MNLHIFLRNYANAKRCCSGVIDRWKYLYWLYSGSIPLGSKKPLTLRTRLEAPLGEVVLSVRCNGGADAFIFSEVFERRYYDFDLPSPPATVLDLGANIGFTALYFARKYPTAQLACVEPMPVNLAVLRQNLARNGVSATVFANAISVEDQPVVMQMAENDYGHKVSHIEYGRPLEGGFLQVAGISVLTVLAELGWPRIGLLKVDIEGYEGVLLRERCEWLEFVDALCIECHEGYSEVDLRGVAQRYGFSSPKVLEGTILMVRNSPPARLLPTG